MRQAAGWGWGLVPLALLWGAATLFTQLAIEQDVAARARTAAHVAARDVPGARPISLAIAGRDVRLAGEALTVDGAARASAQVAATFGVRRVDGELTQVVAQKPYGWAAVRGAGGVTLSGFVPDEKTALANLAAVRSALPGAAVIDDQRVAFGAPEGFVALIEASLPALARLETGKIAVDDRKFCIEGVAATPDGYLALTGEAAPALPAGFSRVDCGLSPPTIAPYRWSAERGEDGALRLLGFYPSAELRQALAAAIAERFPDAVVTDGTKPARGEPSNFADLVKRALGDLARLRSGRIVVSTDGYVLEGQGPAEFAACEALRIQIAQQDGPGSVAQTQISCPPPPPPPAPMPAAPVTENVTTAATVSVAAEQPAAPPAPALAPASAEAVAHAEPSAPQVSFVIEPPPLPAPPAALVPLRWRAERSGESLALSGLVPSEAARSRLLAQAREAVPDASLKDGLRLEIDLRNEPDFEQATRYALSLARQLGEGAVAIDGSALWLSGTVFKPEALAALQAALSARPLPGGLESAAAADLSVRSYEFAATLGEDGVSLTGLLPDEPTRASILAALSAAGQAGKVKDETVIAGGAPEGFASAARAAIGDLSRLERGAVSIRDGAVAVKGETCRDLIRNEVATNLSTALPSGFKGEAEVVERKTGCGKAVSDTCQGDLDAVTRRHAILFEQGTTTLGSDPETTAALDEVAAILKQCPDMRIAVEGHANRDGEVRGFDNLGLSERRALRVEEALVARGVGPAHLASRGFGIARPLLPHGSPESKVRNRRVQFTLER